MTKTVYIINGPNLNLLGKRQPEIYGHDTLEDVERMCAEVATSGGFAVKMLQSNYEGGLVDFIHDARENAAGIILNAGAYTHTSVAVLDALNTFEGPVIELHISQVHKREAFRHHSYISMRADAVMAGFGVNGYALATQHMGSLI
ncbi:type II 3-dehydroquinate dehydratase [Celeribacter sp.]|uniref:type II 3-dehydroquinate dehydratase n=1 Tax=Celeribacter sp. TaxID=1890673 RepID=UPI003A907723